MGYYFDWIDGNWLPLDHDRKVTRKQDRRLQRRAGLVVDLLQEIEDGTTLTKLYAGLLARTLVQTDQWLMQQLGERVAKTDPGPNIPKIRTHQEGQQSRT